MSSYQDDYVKLIAGAGELLEGRINDLHSSSREDLDHLLKAKDRLVSDLLSEPAKAAVEHAFFQLDPRVLDALHLELHYIAANIPPARTHYASEDEINSAAQAVKRGEESLQDMLSDHLPDWMRKLLTLLNHTLSLVFPV